LEDSSLRYKTDFDKKSLGGRNWSVLVMKKILIIFVLVLILLIIPLLSQASSPSKQNFFDGKLSLSNAPSVGQKAIITLDLTDVSGNCNATKIKFNVPGGVSILSRSIFRESSFVKGLSRQYTAEIEVFEEGIYALQASVYFEISKDRYDVEYFFTYLVAGKANSWIADSVDHLTQTKNGIDFHIQKLAPSKSTNAMGTLSLQGYITYYNDNLSRPVPIRNVMVQLYEINQNNPELIGYTYTNSDGLYIFDNTNATKLGDGNPKDIQPKLVFDNDILGLVNNNNEIYTFTLPLIPNVSAGSINSDYFLNESNQQRPLGHLFNTIMDTYDFLQKNINWKRKKLNLKWPYQADNSSYYHIYTTSGSIVSEYIRITGTKQWDRTSMIHEYGHSVMMALYGYNFFNLPKEIYKGTHYINKVSDEGFAMKEGWAEFFVALVNDNAFEVTQFNNLNTPNIEYNEWWKGDGNNTNGALVEGTVSSILWDIADTALSKDEVPDKDDDNISGMFVELWDLMSKNRPQSILEVWDQWQNNNYGQVESLQSIFTNNGVNVAIKPVNHPPTADAKTVETDEDIPLTIKLTGSDTDNDALTYTIVEQPKNGKLSDDVPNLIYTPKPEFNGTDSFTYLVNDGSASSATATVSITIKAVNDPPVANSQTLNTPEDTSVDINLTGSDIDSTDLTFKIVSNPTKGTLEGNAPKLKYTPNSDFFGDDSFTFIINDGLLDSNTATIKIIINAVNDPPIANQQSVTTDENTAIDIVLTGSDIESAPITFKIAKEPASGRISGDLPNIKYSPNSNFFGTDSFTFTVNDGKSNSQPATVTIIVKEVNFQPIANAISLTTNENISVKVNLSGSDVDGDKLTFKVTKQPSNGNLDGTPPELNYTPKPDFNGEDNFSFSVNDGKLESSPVKVSIKVNHVNNPPVANTQSVTTDESIAIKIKLSGSDPDGDEVKFKIITQPTNGTITETLPDLVYEPKYGFGGDDNFTFAVNDGVIDSAPITVKITVIQRTNPFDVNRDGIVNIIDLIIISKYYGKSDFPLDHNPDVNRDHKVDDQDFEIVKNNLGKKV